jgi:hypothetical protein
MLFDRLFNRRQQRQVSNSSAISALEYDPGRHALTVTFTNGRRYQYGCVERETYRMLASAPSAGKFFQAQIRDRYPYRQLTANNNS